jgi:hypothetical protein
MAAKSKSDSLSSFRKKAKKRRPGRNSKNKSSSNKKSKNYKKPYVGQGK